MSRAGQYRKSFAAAAATAILALVALPSAAAAKQCKHAAHTSQATPATYKTTAKQIALKIWSSEVASIHGQPWMFWSKAITKSIRCSQAGYYGPGSVSCVAVARPCRNVIEVMEAPPRNIGIGIGIGDFGLGRPGGFQRPPRGFGRPTFSSRPSIGRRPR